MPSKSYYEVIVGNIGRVYEGNNAKAARAKYNSYVKDSKAKYGRASGEQVSLWKDGDIIAEHDETEPGYTSNPRGRRKVKNTPSDWIPVHAIRKTADGGIQLLTERGVMSNPQRKRGFLKKVERLFSAGGRKVRKALGNPTYSRGLVSGMRMRKTWYEIETTDPNTGYTHYRSISYKTKAQANKAARKFEKQGLAVRIFRAGAE